MNINVGQLLTAVFAARRIRKAALARAMQINAVQINNYLKNESIQTSRLLEISMHLKHNFFMDIAQQLPEDFTTANDIFASKNKEITELKEALKKCSIERDLLLQIQTNQK
jgi:plasmid maintenance system antidote protein VapI